MYFQTTARLANGDYLMHLAQDVDNQEVERDNVS